MGNENVWRDWTDQELARDLAFWREAVEAGNVRPDNRLDLLVESIEAELARRAA